MAVEIRAATRADDEALCRLDDITWSPDVTPTPPRPPGVPFFGERREPRDTLVAVESEKVVGYVNIGHAHPIEAGRHVFEVQGLAVDPAAGRRGIGRQLMESVLNEARTRGGRRLTLRVLGPNKIALALYRSMGFELEGTLRQEFLLEGRYVDDLLMAISLT